MIHFGINKLSYHVCFDESCYYPVVFSDADNIRVLFGVSYGWLARNFLGIAWKPNTMMLDKIDLYSCIIHKSNLHFQYLHTIDTNQEYDIVISPSPKHSFVGIEGYKLGEQGETKTVFKYSTPYKYPSVRMGLTVKNKAGFNILLKRN